MNRRELLHALSRRAAALAASQLFAIPISTLRAAPLPAMSSDPFTLGVASGMPRPDSVVLWTRLAPRPHETLGGLPAAPIEVRWELADDERFALGLRQGQVQAQPQHAHSVHVEVSGLPSGRSFFYRFMAGDAVSPVGRTRTAPPLDAAVSRLRIALASCQHYEQGEYAAHREIAGRDLDLVLFVGDYIYESSNPRYRIRPHEGTVPTTLDGYRARHATYKLDPALQAAHAAHPWVLTWDDHEVENDYAGDRGSARATPEQFLLRRAAAYKAYFEHLPVAPGMAPVGSAMRIHDRYVWGRLAELFTLDNRQYRSRQGCAADDRAGGRLLNQCDDFADARRSVFGEAQERWLASGLARSDRQWKLLGQGTQLGPSGLDTPLGRRLFTDGWEGYGPARERLLRAIAEPGVGNVINLGGDVHRHLASQLRLRPNDPSSPIVASEFVCSSITSRGLPELATEVMRSGNPDLVHARSDERGYAFIEITPAAARCDFRATPFPARLDVPLVSQAKCLVEAGHAGVRMA
jgi:alkaline phosphatase D